MMTLTLVVRLAVLVGVMLSGVTGLGGEAPRPQPEQSPATIEDADDLLRALETAGGDMRRLSAQIRYIKTFAIQGDTQQRDGRLAFVSGDDSERRRFAITFERFELDGGRRVEDVSTGYTERYAFDGEWLAEARPLEKQFVRRQVVPPGESWDPLRLGEGPFPIPIQQDREVILERFSAELLDGEADVVQRSLLGVAGKCYQLRLVPLPEIGEKELREIRVWYDRETLLPRMARTVSRSDDESFVLLRDLRLNGEAEIDESDLSTAPPSDRAGWNITIDPYAG
jgi:hypothetical protein